MTKPKRDLTHAELFVRLRAHGWRQAGRFWVKSRTQMIYIHNYPNRRAALAAALRIEGGSK